MTAALQAAAHALRGARHVVVFTGAGISAESGIPTFCLVLVVAVGRRDRNAAYRTTAIRYAR